LAGGKAEARICRGLDHMDVVEAFFSQAPAPPVVADSVAFFNANR
jgi:hypothetical protein